MTSTPTTPTPPASQPTVDPAGVRTALATGPRPPRAGPLATAAAFGWRGILKIKHVPE